MKLRMGCRCNLSPNPETQNGLPLRYQGNYKWESGVVSRQCGKCRMGVRYDKYVDCRILHNGLQFVTKKIENGYSVDNDE